MNLFNKRLTKNKMEVFSLDESSVLPPPLPPANPGILGSGGGIILVF